jgi:hypothetical protein
MDRYEVLPFETEHLMKETKQNMYTWHPSFTLHIIKHFACDLAFAFNLSAEDSCL